LDQEVVVNSKIVKFHQRKIAFATMSAVVGKLLLGVSIIGLIHSGWTVIEFRQFVAAASSVSSPSAVPLPFDVVAELIVAMVLGLVGAVLFNGPLQNIKSGVEFAKRSYADLEHRKAFRVYGSSRSTVSRLASKIKAEKKSK
jgi:hypothetical protein